MESGYDYPAWIFLVMGIYALAAGIGEWRSPGYWALMVGDMGRRPATRFIAGLVCMAIGAALYIPGSWDWGDWMLAAVKIIGGWMIIEGALILAVGDRFIGFAQRLMAAGGRIWAALSILIGLAMMLAAILRF